MNPEVGAYITRSQKYPVAEVAGGEGLLVVSGMTGGDLVFDYGINVRGVNSLLGQ